MAQTFHPRARCHALNVKLETCNIPFSDHGSTKHTFRKRPVRKHHIPWKLLGQDYSYCGRRPYHYQNPDDMVWVPAETAASVRRMARDNVLCTACFKNWMYLLHRAEFIVGSG